jgi:hypothetical protein
MFDKLYLSLLESTFDFLRHLSYPLMLNTGHLSKK